MNKNVLSEEFIDSKALEKMESFHVDTVSEVIKSVADNKIVVVGMKHNPVVKKAKNLLNSRNIEFTYLEYGSYLNDWKKRLAIKLWSGWPTFPQVFIDGKLVGGCNELEKHLEH